MLPPSWFDSVELWVSLTCVRMSNCRTMCLRMESRLEGWPGRTSSECVRPLSSSSSSLLPLPPVPAAVWLPAVEQSLLAPWSPVRPWTLELAARRAGGASKWPLAAAWVDVKCVSEARSCRWKHQRMAGLLPTDIYTDISDSRHTAEN